MFKGIYTPIVTPFDDEENIDFEKMYHNLDRWSNSDLAGIVVLGSNGEFVYLSEGEKLSLVKKVIEHFGNDKHVIVGTSCESTKATIELSQKVADLGADAVLTLPPHYYKGRMTDDVLQAFYTDVADESPAPVFIYNMPANTGINLSAALVANLSRHPNIVGIKDTSGSIVQLSELIRDSADDFAVFPGNAGYLFPALTVGADGATLALANILADECCKLYSLYHAGRIDEAQKLQLKFLEINSLVTGKLGIPALKAAMDMLGYEGGKPRRPLRPLLEAEKNTVKDALRRCGAIKQ